MNALPWIARWMPCKLAPAAMLTLIFLTGCNISVQENPGLKETQLEINVQQTLLAQQIAANTTATFSAQQAPSGVQPSPSATQPLPTQTLQAAQGLNESQSATQTALAAQAVTSTPTATEDLESLMKSASILLYEDMIAHLDTNRYVKDTLDAMGLPYVDVGSAKGWLKSQLLSGGPNGKGWDLVIIAAENKSGVQGEFFEYVSAALDQGSSVILEIWYLDDTSQGSASTLLSRCGIEYEDDYEKIPPNRMVLFPLDPTHPILQEPNPGLTFTDTMSYWWDPDERVVFDIGDLVQLRPGGSARLLVGTQPTSKDTHGTLTACIDDRLILQTFSSHQFTYNAMKPVWENYIYNALRVRFQGK